MRFNFDYKEPKIVAEIGCNHMGDFEIAKELIKLAKDAGVEVCLDGLGMLVGQAAVSFKIWTGKRPSTNRVLNLIKSSL